MSTLARALHARRPGCRWESHNTDVGDLLTQKHIPLSQDAALVVALRTMFDPAAAGSFKVEVALHVISSLGEERLRARVVGGRLELGRGPAENPAATLQSDPETFKGLAFGGLPLEAAQKTGALTLTGNPAQAERFFGLFRLPEPVAT